MVVHLNIYRMDGLNVDTDGFNWQNRILFTNSKLLDKHTATAYVRLERSVLDPIYKEFGETVGSQTFRDLEASYHLLSIFFACYGLASRQPMPKIDMTGSGGFDIDEDKISVKNLIMFIGIDKPSTYGSTPIDKTMESLKKTVPLFEKVMNIVEGQKQDHKLNVALIMYYRASLAMESIEELVDRITAIEALFSDSTTEMRYKISMRTALFVQRDASKRREYFEFLKKAYDARSTLVHGGDVSLGLVNKYRPFASGLRDIVADCLLDYIELAQKKTKQEIINAIDNMALGIK